VLTIEGGLIRIILELNGPSHTAEGWIIWIDIALSADRLDNEEVPGETWISKVSDAS
jgi:hypothetical protein